VQNSNEKKENSKTATPAFLSSSPLSLAVPPLCHTHASCSAYNSPKNSLPRLHKEKIVTIIKYSISGFIILLERKLHFLEVLVGLKVLKVWYNLTGI